MANIKYEINDAAVHEAFNTLIALGEDPHNEMDAIGRVLKNNILRCFDGSHDPNGNAWKQLKSRDGKPLIKSGQLRNSIDYQVKGKSVEVGTNKIQAALQNFGGKIVPKNKKALFFMVGDRKVFAQSVTIPAREFIPTDRLPDAWREDVLKVLCQAIENVQSGQSV